MYKDRRRNKIIIISLLVILFIMAGAYSAFSSQLSIKSSSKVTSNWDIEITNVTDGVASGTAENASSPTWDALKASMEANLYSSGDSMEYDVTISNKGTLDAKLDDITTNLSSSNSEAVIITFSGYTKGEKLLVGESKVVHVKIAYNPSYTGDETSSEVEINFDYVQNNNETEPSSNTYLLTYDCETNGGNSCTNNNEYLVKGSIADLSKTGTKKGNIFVGWNTDSTSTNKLDSYTMPESDSTLYAMYREENVTLTLSTTSTTNSITAVANVTSETGISKYEYSIDNGSTWITGDSNTYTFNKLNQGTSYNVLVKITSNSGKEITSDSLSVTTKTIETPTFSETQTSGKNTITISYPSGCGSTYTCTYQKGSDTAVTVTSTTATLTVTTSGTVVAKITDGTNTVSSSYNTTIKYNVTTSKNSTVGITVTPSTTFTSSGTSVTFTVPSKSGYTYQGSQIKNSSGTVVQTLNSSTKSFTMPSYDVKIAPIYKYNDKTILKSGGTKDTTFSMSHYDTDKPIFYWAENSFYAFSAYGTSTTDLITTRAEAMSDKTYQVNQYCNLTFSFSGSTWVSSSKSNGRSLTIGLVRSKNTWLITPTGTFASSPDYVKSISLKLSTIDNQTLELTLSSSQSSSNKYYIVIQYLSYYASTSLNFIKLYFTGCTYYS